MLAGVILERPQATTSKLGTTSTRKVLKHLLNNTCALLNNFYAFFPQPASGFPQQTISTCHPAVRAPETQHAHPAGSKTRSPRPRDHAPAVGNSLRRGRRPADPPLARRREHLPLQVHTETADEHPEPEPALRRDKLGSGRVTGVLVRSAIWAFIRI